MPDRNPLRLVALACHALLLIATVALLYRSVAARPWAILVAVAGAAPLLVTLPGLLAARAKTEQWLALLLVVYAGAAIVEVIASAATRHLAATALLASVTELALLFVLSQRSRRSRARAAPE